MESTADRNRRQFLKASLATSSLAFGGFLSIDAKAQGALPVKMQLGWFAGGNQVGEIVAKRLGYYEQEGIDFSLIPGGPNSDGIAIVASGADDLGQAASSPEMMMAISQGIPIRCFAVAMQKHPFCFFSLEKNPVRKPADFVGKRVGLPNTSLVLLRAVLAKNNIAEKDVQIIPIGGDMSPLLNGQVDVVVGWLTSTTALKVLGKDRVDLPLWDAGVHLYALPYYATVDAVQKQPKALAAFLRATTRGWQYARTNRDQATDLLVKEYPNLNRADERVALDATLAYGFTDATTKGGWGTMDPAVWQDQISTWSQLKQFTAKTPTLDEVMTLDVLKATFAARMHA